MRSDEDLLAYASARWPVLVRTLVLLGCPESEAADVASEALSRCRREWAATSRDGDVDALVFGELLAAWHRHARVRGLDPGTGVEDHVLRGYAGLTGERPDPALHERADEVRPGPPPTLADLDEHRRARRRAVTRRAVAVVVPLLLVLAGLTWWTTRGDDDPGDDAIGPARVEQARNALPTVWWADGVLHLAATEVRIPDLRTLTTIGPGVVYGDQRGRVVSVSDDGSRRLLGRKDPRAPVVAGDDNGWVAWIDTEQRALRVQDAYGSRQVGELSLALTTGTARLVALDGATVYYRDNAGAHAWNPDGDPTGRAVSPVAPAQLADVRSRIRVFQSGPSTIQVVQSAFNVAYTLPGYGARLSPDGDTVATRLDESRYGRLQLYDSRSGEPLDLEVADDEAVLGYTFGFDDTLTLAVARTEDLSRSGPFLRDFLGGTVELRSCTLDRRTGVSCTDVVELRQLDDAPVLAR